MSNANDPHEQIAEVFEKWRKAGAAGDVQTIASLITEDGGFWTQGAPPLVGREAAQQAFARALESYIVNQDFEILEEIILEDLAFIRGIETNTVTPRGQGESIIRKQRAFMIMRRGSDGQWRFARGMTNIGPELA